MFDKITLYYRFFLGWGGGGSCFYSQRFFFSPWYYMRFFCRGLAGLHDSLRHTMLAVSLGQAIEVICFFSHAMFSSVTRSRIFFLQSRDVRCFSFSSILYMSSPIKMYIWTQIVMLLCYLQKIQIHDNQLGLIIFHCVDGLPTSIKMEIGNSFFKKIRTAEIKGNNIEKKNLIKKHCGSQQLWMNYNFFKD